MTEPTRQDIAIVLLSDRGMDMARAIGTRWPQAQIHGLTDRVTQPDVAFSSTTEALKTLFQSGTTIIGFCATGILIRALAPTLSDKRAEPPVIAVSDDGQIVVPLLGGLTGANELAAELAIITNGSAAITASGARAFGLQLENPPPGYTLANPKNAKRVTSDLLAGKSVHLEGHAAFLTDSKLPVTDDGDIPIQISIAPPSTDTGGLIYHPRQVAVFIDTKNIPPDGDITLHLEALSTSNVDVTPSAFGSLLLPEGVEPTVDQWDHLQTFSNAHNLPVRYISQTPDLATLAQSGPVRLLDTGSPDALAAIGRNHGALTIVGVGPGDRGFLTADAREALASADDLVGYDTYLALVPERNHNQTRHASGNRVEIERAEQALDLAVDGRQVALVTSGDPGIFAMASAVLEALEAKPDRWTGLDITVIPGISAMQTAASRIGAPLGHDFCTISLSDIRKPWDVVAKRLRAAAEADFVIALYNPASKTRREQIRQTKALLLTLRTPDTPVILGRNLGRPGEDVEITTLGTFDPDTIDMRTVLLIGSSRTRTFEGPGHTKMVYTPRTYETD